MEKCSEDNWSLTLFIPIFSPTMKWNPLESNTVLWSSSWWPSAAFKALHLYAPFRAGGTRGGGRVQGAPGVHLNLVSIELTRFTILCMAFPSTWKPIIYHLGQKSLTLKLEIQNWNLLNWFELVLIKSILLFLPKKQQLTLWSLICGKNFKRNSITPCTI